MFEDIRGRFFSYSPKKLLFSHFSRSAFGGWEGDLTQTTPLDMYNSMKTNKSFVIV